MTLIVSSGYQACHCHWVATLVALVESQVGGQSGPESGSSEYVGFPLQFHRISAPYSSVMCSRYVGPQSHPTSKIKIVHDMK
jgi:hypothetical protein